MKPLRTSLPSGGHRVAALLTLALSVLTWTSESAAQTRVATLDQVLLLPQSYRNVQAVQPGSASEPVAQGAWWERYGSRELNELVDRARAQNPDLRIATLQIAQARIRADQARAGSLPFISAPVRTVAQGSGTTTDGQQSSQLGLQATYRLDIWGEQNALESSAELQMWRAVYERQNVVRNVIGNLVASYLAWLEVGDSIAYVRDNEALTRRVLQTVEQKYALGEATSSELEMQRAAVQQAVAQLASLEGLRDDYQTSLARVLGTTVAQLPLRGSGLDELTLPRLEPGMPARLLLQRPDVRLVEARLQAAQADIEVARARLLPPIDLSAQVGYSALGLANLLQPQNLLTNAITSLAITIFDGGRRAGNKASADLAHEQLVETYAQTLLQALREVESTINAYRTARLRADAQQATLRASLAMYKAAVDAYGADALDLPGVLDAKRSLQRVQDDWQKARGETLRAYANVAFALGGSMGDASAAQASAVPEGVLLAEAAQPGSGWDVELAPLAHRSTLAPTWRELQRRFGDVLSGKQLQALRQGGVSDRSEEAEAWYRLAVTGFAAKAEAEEFCGAMRQGLQACKVVQHGS